jgi:Predicted Zn peptidase
VPELILKHSVARKIEQRINRLHNDLGYPAPPIDLDNIRELLEIDKRFYTLDDPHLLNRIAHSMIIAGKRILNRPTRIWEAICKFDIKAVYIPDEKSIFIDDSLPEKKKRWAESHEIGHSLLLWHKDYLHGDPNNSLSISCKAKIEAEANYAAGQILFPAKFFRETLPSEQSITLDYIQKTLSKEFGNSVTSTLWRTVETLETPCFGFISENPHTIYSTVNDTPTRHFFRSPAFAEYYISVTEEHVWQYVSANCSNKKWKILDEEISIKDSNGDSHTFHIETFNLTHYLATFALCVR